MSREFIKYFLFSAIEIDSFTGDHKLINMKLRKYLVAILFMTGCSAQQTSHEMVRGIYGDPNVLISKGYLLNELGINSIFVHMGSITPDLIERAHQQNIKVYAEFPLLNGKEFLKHDSSAWPIDATGNRSPQADWFMGICPSNPDFKKYREAQLRTLLNTFKVDGVWLDYVHWHAQFESPEPILPETCFCEYCLKDFSASGKLTLPEGDSPAKASWILKEHDQEWRKWRAEVINGWIKDFRTIVRAHNPELKLGIYYCPWYPDDFNHAAYRILGLDIARLYKEADVLSPMIYHGRMGRDPEWVGEYLQWFQREIIAKEGMGAAIWPIVQASDEPVRITPEEFRNVMIKGMSGPSTGIMMFSTWAFQDDIQKIEVMKDLYMRGFTKPQ
jgi:hypothetical protein